MTHPVGDLVVGEIVSIHQTMVAELERPLNLLPCLPRPGDHSLPALVCRLPSEPRCRSIPGPLSCRHRPTGSPRQGPSTRPDGSALILDPG
jgi:hypothetical protein